MPAVIGNTLIKTIKPNGKQFDIRDAKLKGFMIRVNPTGTMSFVCEYKRGKRITIARVGVMTPAQARDKAREILACAAKGEDPIAYLNRDKRITLKKFINDHYQPWVLAHRKSGRKSLNRIIRCFVVPYGNKPLAEINPLLIEGWRTKRLNEKVSTETINRDIATFKASLSKAVEWGLTDKNPLSALKLLKIDRTPKVRFLDKDEEKRLRDALDERDCQIRSERESANQWRQERNYTLLPKLGDEHFSDHLKPMVLLSMNTGIRQGELFQLRWSDVDLKNANITIAAESTKSSHTRHIPLNSEALSVLTIWRVQTADSQLVFPSGNNQPFNNVRKSWLNLLKRAQICNFRWHDMRHHFASRLVMAGVDLNTVRELLGHSDLKMTLRYAHLAPEHKANAVAKLCSAAA